MKQITAYMDGDKILCISCNNFKQKQDFSEDEAQRLGRYRCNWCVEKIQYKKIKREEKYLAAKYGLSVERLLYLREKAKGKCEVCNLDRKLVIDHCHDSGVVRGLICRNCNIALGLMKDSPILIDKLASYARKHQHTKELPNASSKETAGSEVNLVRRDLATGDVGAA